MEKNNQSIAPIFLTVLIDMIGIGIVIPVIGLLFIDPTSGILPSSYSFSLRTILLGLLLASYPLAQFFGSPILGSLSDVHGRKKILVISLIGTFIGYVLFAIAILIGNAPLLFISRIIDGITGGNISVAMSSIADISDGKEKVKRFGMIGMAFGLGIIIGPFIGGKLADPSISFFNHATPFWFAALLTLVNIILVIFRFKETLKHPKNVKIGVLTGFRNIHKAFSFSELRLIFVFSFLFTLGFSFFTQFFQVFLIEKFKFTEPDIGTLFGFMGLCIALTQGFIVRNISKWLKPHQILIFSTLMVSIAISLMLIPAHVYGIYYCIIFMAIFNGLTMPNMTAIASDVAKPEHQGEILGIQQSLQALGMTIPPLIAGFFAAIDYRLPIIIGSLFVFLSWLVFVFYFKYIKLRKEVPPENEVPVMNEY